MKRIRLGNAVFEGLNDVYVLDGETTALVDTGISTPAVESELADGLAEFGLEFADVDEVLLTHWHQDHAGLAGAIQRESGCVVRVHEADAPLVSGAELPPSSDPELRREVFDRWGMPDAAREELAEVLDVNESFREVDADVTPFADGDRFTINGIELEAMHLPGHAAGLAAFAFDRTGVDTSALDDAGLDDSGLDDHEAETGTGPEPTRDGSGDEVAFVGDAILPRYTPNVGGADLRMTNALDQYVNSLVRIIDREWSVAYPGHRDTIADPSRRAAVILEHHRERTERVIDVLREHGPLDAWSVSAHLFGDLSEVHILHGPGEAYAHLEHLADAGVVEREGTEYLLLDDDPDVRSLFPETRFYGRVEAETEGR
ncbi:MBL fold metallo-hydrolase [Halopenitus persicus]|uniref:Glyoxylase, beta-lactamase superfamily II n=1 Tax=Halopenitus persicus TaxID=1048396 RepID=A0A1H3HHX0_9EURY|nr:MBL fold metallo-hydrolase [Halopenitus persicus]SDY14394.1 Glyoxylase, beta-lactamase superfamily II [Halopenitus persicus]